MLDINTLTIKYKSVQDTLGKYLFCGVNVLFGVQQKELYIKCKKETKNILTFCKTPSCVTMAFTYMQQYKLRLEQKHIYRSKSQIYFTADTTAETSLIKDKEESH